MSARLDSRLAWQVIGGEGVVLDLAAQQAFGLNRSAAFLWERLPGHDEAELAAMLAERYGLPLAAARQDVAAFLADLRRRRLLVEDAG